MADRKPMDGLKWIMVLHNALLAIFSSVLVVGTAVEVKFNGNLTEFNTF